jgi:hypothetical protein
MPVLLTVAEAANLAGVSVRTMRRRVAAGQVATAGHGQARRIVAASVAAPIAPSETATTAAIGHQGDSDRPASVAMTEDMTEDNTATRVTTASEIAPLAELVERLTERLAEQTGLTAMWQERAGTLADRLAAAESKLLALEAPKSPKAASTAPRAPDPTRGPSVRRWRSWVPWQPALIGAIILVGVLGVLVAVVVLLAWPR